MTSTGKCITVKPYPSIRFVAYQELPPGVPEGMYPLVVLPQRHNCWCLTINKPLPTCSGPHGTSPVSCMNGQTITTNCAFSFPFTSEVCICGIRCVCHKSQARYDQSSGFQAMPEF
ncbi:hypothetical protein FVEG_15842 [Fusarium verticillioides 7600]|uniref:Uncharacterized protein n=1 Tax=Gibberella moniliformis (strain M3125 / FGSC 7600) TaxID=334819 RepID=W7MLR4_GIBM7|nr:hypothetical protein FVEG_15842 [Fusarium verticillioides 7600]EWG45602.1 hypothetical protein FVEG_15842 [Fusarium verticillioides 7600]